MRTPQPAYGSTRRPGSPRWWPLASYLIVAASLLASAAGAGFWAGRKTQPPPLDFAIPTATPPAPVTAYIAGVVAEPGVYTLAAGARLIDLVVAAGGLLPGADHAALNLAARLTDGQRVIVPTVRPTLLPSPGTPSKERDPSQTRDSTPGAAVTEAKQLNLNTASEAELDSLPRIGPAMAAAIVEWRAANGGFRSVEDLLRVRGIGAATLEALRPYVTAP